MTRQHLKSDCSDRVDISERVFDIDTAAVVVDIEVDEARKLGMRMTVTRGSMNLSQKDGGLPPDSVVQDEDTILADSERLLNRYHDRSEGASIRVALAPCSPFSVTKRLMAESAALLAVGLAAQSIWATFARAIICEIVI